MPPFASAWDRPESDTTGYLQPRLVRVRLRDGRVMEGCMHVAEGQSVVEFLGLRRAFLNLTDVRGLDDRAGEAPLAHVGLRLSHIVWVVPLDSALPLSPAVLSPEASRAVALVLAGDLELRVRIQIADELRISDYFDAHPDFIPLRSVRTGDETVLVDRMAVNGAAIRTFREI